MSVALDLALLGKPRVRLNGQSLVNPGTNKNQALLYYLAVTDEEHPREHLANLLWGSDSAEKARTSLRVALAGLRKILPDHLDIQRHTVAVKLDSMLNLDAHLFEDYGAELGRAQPDHENLRQAISLYQGDFLTDFHVDDAPAFEEWLLGERERYRQLAIDILYALATGYQADGQYGEAQAVLQQLLTLDPWSEEAHFVLMEVLSRLGDFNGALTQYRKCKELLAAELDAEPMPETTALFHRIEEARSARRHNLPAEPSPFVGRVKELATLLDKLASPDCQLVTVTGLGGMGKSRFALAGAREIAEKRRDLFLNGIVYSSLTAIQSAERLPPWLAERLGIKLERSDDALTRVIYHLEDRESLLVLDGFELLLRPSEATKATDIIIQILNHCPQVKCLITSREPLTIREEWRLELYGLTVPTDLDEKNLDDYSAIQLFLQGAKQVRPGYRIQDDEKAGVIALCQLLGGIPLGITLSAAWLRGMSVQRIVTEISQNLDFLSTRMRDVPARQRSMRAVLDYSWSLLTPSEQATFRSLAAFQGDFSQQAALAVLNVQIKEIKPAILDALVAHSLLQSQAEQVITTPDGEGPEVEIVRYSMHQMVRQFAQSKLSDTPEEEQTIRTAHCQYYVAFLKQQTALFSGFDESIALTAIGREDENLQAAWNWAVLSFTPSALVELVNGISLYFQLIGPFQEAEVRYKRAIEAIRRRIQKGQLSQLEAEPILGKLLVEQTRFLINMSRNEIALQVIDSLLALNETLRSPELAAAARSFQSRALFYTGELDQAYLMAQQALTIAKAAQVPAIELDCYSIIGFFYLQRNEYEQSRAAYEEGVAIARKLKDRRSERKLQNNLGVIAVQQSDYQQATTYYEQALNLAAGIGDRPGEAHYLNNLGRVYSEQRNFGRAEAHLRHARYLAREIGSALIESNVLLSWGRNAMYTGNWRQATDFFEQAIAMKRAISDLHGEGEVLTYRGLLRHIQGDHRRSLEESRQALAMVQESNSEFVIHFALTNIGHSFNGLGQLPAAADAYQKAMDGRQALGHLNLSMEPRAGLVEIALKTQDLATVQAHLAPILAHINAGSLDGTDQPFRIYWVCYQALLSINSAQAEELLVKAKDELTACTEQIPDPDMRQSFLQNIPVHALIANA